MALNKNLILLIFFVSLFVFSCNDDETDDNPDVQIGDSFFSLNGTEYTMASTGGLENYGELPGEYDGTNLDLILVSNATGIENDDDGQNAIARSDNYLDLEMYSSSSERLSAGQYTFSSSSSHPAFSFSDVDYEIDEADTGSQLIVGDEVNVDITNGQYKITFALLGEDGKTVSGSFNGQLIMYPIDPN